MWPLILPGTLVFTWCLLQPRPFINIRSGVSLPFYGSSLNFFCLSNCLCCRKSKWHTLLSVCTWIHEIMIGLWCACLRVLDVYCNNSIQVQALRCLFPPNTTGLRYSGHWLIITLTIKDGLIFLEIFYFRLKVVQDIFSKVIFKKSIFNLVTDKLFPFIRQLF